MDRSIEWEVGKQAHITPKGMLAAEEIWLAAEKLTAVPRGKKKGR
jgi:hypothetical protein